MATKKMGGQGSPKDDITDNPVLSENMNAIDKILARIWSVRG